MNDHRPIPDDDALDLALAYLDDDLDPIGRATVESSPELLDLVAELRWAQEFVIDGTDAATRVDPVTSTNSARLDAAISAALEVFDRDVVPSLSRTDELGTVTPLASARRWRRATMLVSAAAAGLLLVGIVVTSLGGSMSSDDLATSGGAENAESRVASQVAAGDAPTGATGATAADAASSTLPSPVDTIDTIIGPASVPTVIDDPVVLLELAGQVLGVGWITGDPAAITPPPADLDLFGCTPTLSPTQLIIATITFVDQPALAVADLATSSVAAIDLGCNVIAEAAYTK